MAERRPLAPHESSDKGQDHPGDQERPEAGHETSDLSVRAVLIFIAGLAVSLGLVCLILWGMFVALLHHEDAEKESDLPLVRQERTERPQPQDRFPRGAPGGSETREPPLEGIDPDVGRKGGGPANWPSVPQRSGVPGWPSNARELYDRDAAVLDSYGWVDRDRKVARIPIERAMDLTIEKLRPPEGKR